MRLLRTALAAGLLLASERVARADDEELARLLEENVVAGPSRTAELAKDAPATTSTITGDDMRRYGIRSLAEAIDFLSLGLVTQDAIHTAETGSRGVLVTGDYNDHLLVMIDGHIVNEAFSSSVAVEQGLGLPLELVDRVEIAIGPGSVMYGGSAMLGVINIITRRAASYGGPRVVAEGTLSPGQSRGHIDSVAPRDLGASYRVGAGFGHELELLGKKVEVTAQLERYGANAPTFVYDQQRFSNADGTAKDFGARAIAPGIWGGALRSAREMDVTSGYARIVAGDLTVTLRGASFDRDTPFPTFNQSFGNFDDARSGEHELQLALGTTYTRTLTSRLALTVQAWGRTYDYRQQVESADGADCPNATTGACRYFYFAKARWAGINAAATYDWLGDDRLTTMAGVVGQYRWVGTSQDSIEASSGTSVGKTTDVHTIEVPVGAFVQQRWSPATGIHLNGGIRFDDVPRGGRNVSPRVAASLDPWRGGTLKAIYAAAFRAPSYYEASVVAPGIVQSSPLQPEHEKSVEATLEQRVGHHRILFGAFRTWWTDMIGYVCAESGSCQYANSARIDSWGFNGAVDGTLGPVQYGLSVTGARSRQTSEDGTTPLTVAPQLYGNARVAYDFGSGRPVLALASQLVGMRLADRALDGGWATTPVAPVQVRAKLTISGPVPSIAGLSYRVGLDVASASRSAYVASPYGPQDGVALARPALAPVNRFTALGGIQYAF